MESIHSSRIAGKYERNLQLTMDYDSGYISHHQESNSDTSLDGNHPVDSVEKNMIYLSEDALLEKPEIGEKSIDLSQEIENEDYEQTRRLFFSSPDLMLNSSVESRRTTYSGLENDSELSIEIPESEQIIVDSKCFEDDEKMSPVLCKYNDNEGSPILIESRKISEINNFENIHPKPKKKLTLVFSKNKENNYSVKRKFPSLSPIKTMASPMKVMQSPMETNRSPMKIMASPIKTMGSHMTLMPSPMKTIISSIKIMPSPIKRMRSPMKIMPSPMKIMHSPLKTVISPMEVIQSPMKVISPLNIMQSPLKTRSPMEIMQSPMKSMVSPNKQNSTPEKKTNPLDTNITPDLFEEDEKQIVSSSNEIIQPLDFISEEKYINKKDHRLIRRVQNGLNGVLPPPSVTIVQMSAEEILEKIQNNTEYFWDKASGKENGGANSSLNSSNGSSDGFKSLLENVDSRDKFENGKFPGVLEYRFHGLHHNRSKLSEEFEDLCDKYARRFVGADTQSSCTVFASSGANGSPSKRRDARPRWQAKSPGRRLSHLARRRITFSSTNLQGAGAAGSRARQILVDARKLDLLNRRKSPRKTPRKTPRKSPRANKARTPSSSAKKKLAMRFRELSGEFEKTVPSTSSDNMSNRSILTSPAISESSRSSISSTSSLPLKRELFPGQIKDKNTASLLLPSTSRRVSTSSTDSAKTRRALFLSPSKKNSPPKGKRSPFKKSPLKHLGLGYDKKRKRSECDGESKAKVPRGEAENGGSVGPARTRGEMIVAMNRSGAAGRPQEMTDVQKKRLQWAVYEALRSQNVTVAHPQFKTFASVLARVTRHFLLAAGGRPETVAGDKMLRVAKTHVYAVVKGKSVDETIGEYAGRAKREKPSGYVGVEEFQARGKVSSSAKRDTVLQDRSNTIESWEKRKLEQLERTKGVENKVERIRKVINFDNR